MNHDWNPFYDSPKETGGYLLNKGSAHLYNFYLAKTACESLIIMPGHDGIIAENMFGDILGIYPQPPFSLHVLSKKTFYETKNAFESIRLLMSKTDEIEYPSWDVHELEPFYQNKNHPDVTQ